MRLADLEQAVQAHVLAGGELPAALVSAVAPPAAERWQIYTEGYRLRLTEALGLQYPALLARLGAEADEARRRLEESGEEPADGDDREELAVKLERLERRREALGFRAYRAEALAPDDPGVIRRGGGDDLGFTFVTDAAQDG